MRLKQKVLLALEECTEKQLSGEEIAKALGVSRTAVWKAVNALREDGYTITSSTKTGYTLEKAGGPLTVDGIRANLPEHLADLQIQILEETDSTNDHAKRLIAEQDGENRFLIIANRQTAGRGRLGRSFFSPAASGLYMTVCYPVNRKLDEVLPITSAAAVAVVETVEELTDKHPEIKWVNDVYLGNKKICGILTEAVASMEVGSIQNIIVGIGINLTTKNFPQELQQVAASLEENELSRARLAAGITKRLLAYAEELPEKRFLEAYRAHSLIPGHDITYRSEGTMKSAYAIGIDDQCGLIIRRPDGVQEVLRTGEVTVRLAD